MPKRKTFKVEKLKELINYRNRHSTCSAEVRKGWNSLFVDILLEMGNYEGFRYLNPDEVPAGQLAGIDKTKTTSVNRYPDSSRVVYF